jgi:predicted nucleotidyltransferase
MGKTEADSVIESYDELSSSLERLSNHFQKYRQLVEKNIPELRQRLADKGVTGKVHLWRKSHNYKRQMAEVAAVAENAGETKKFIGTYYALQMLHLHFVSTESLRRDYHTKADMDRVYRQILYRLRIQRKDLISVYIRNLIEVFDNKICFDGIVICNVGMIMDQDDLDIAIFSSPDTDKKRWNTVIGQISAEFFKYSSKMHFYLAELVATDSYLTTISDFEEFLSRDVSNYILISELLASEFLLGDESLMPQIETQIINKFYYDRHARYYHEAYLRGLMAELQHQSQRKIDNRWASPKNDALRLIHNAVSLLKTIYGIHEHGSRDTLESLQVRDTASKRLYINLQKTFNFCEMFLHVYQLLISIDDRFDAYDSVNIKNLDLVAEVMGYEPLGPVRSGSRLLVHYFEELELLTEMVSDVMTKVNNHLKEITVFNDLLNNNKPPDLNIQWTDSLIRNLFFTIKQFKGLRYWDDILQLMGEDNGRRLIRLVKSIEKLASHHRLHVFRRLVETIAYDMDSMIVMAVLFNRYIQMKSSINYSNELNLWLLELLKKDQARVKALIGLVFIHPVKVTHFLIQLGQEQLSELGAQVDKVQTLDDVAEKQKNIFVTLCHLLAVSSNNYRRFFSKVVESRPEIVTHIDDMRYLDRVRQLLWAELSDAENPEDLKERLIVFYQFGFCRCGLEALNRPGDLETFYRMYHAFFRRYFRWLYRSAQWSIEKKRIYPFQYRDRDDDDQPVAIFCTGGYAREEAFENDIDLFVLCDSEDELFLRYASSIVNDINRELNRQGVLPHHRFAEIFNKFVIPTKMLKSRFETPDENDFIDWAQLLGARMLVGSQSFDRFLSNLLNKKLFSNPRRFIECLINEINDRRDSYKKMKTRPVNVKENPGGLRDIQLVLQAAQAFIGNRELDIWKTFQTLSNEIPVLAGEFKTLERVYKFLRTFKDIYYLSLSAEDDMIRDRLIYVSEQMGIDSANGSNSNGSAPRLINIYKGHRYRARQAVDVIGKYLLEKTEKCNE